MGWFFQFTFQIKNLDLLLLTDDDDDYDDDDDDDDDDKSHYVYIKDFKRFMFHKTRNKNKKWFCKSCLQCFGSENVLTKHKKDCISINGKQSVKLEEEKIEFENYFKQISVLFKIYADFEYNLESVESYEDSYTKK